MAKLPFKTDSYLFLVTFLIILIIFSFWFSYVFIFVQTPWGIISSESSGDWLQWMGGVVGGIIGGVFTFLGIKITLGHQRKDIEYENKRRALPLIDIKTGIEEYDYRNKYIQFDFLLTEESKSRARKDIEDTAKITIGVDNVGLRELYDLYIGDFNSTYFSPSSEYYHVTSILYNNQLFELNLSFYEKGSYVEDNLEGRSGLLSSGISFKCYFKDCYNNWYNQEFELSMFHKIHLDVGLSEQALEISVQKSEVKSKPIEILERDLPWKNGKTYTSC
ncbi:hypothetical protein ACQCU1_01850 [Sutcliffiella horikoshii]|uniref:hypothetical protein n=1 Tax=Sutcliffiella horikoshii TaxID=79883 RepID=UPI003CEE7CB0